MEYVTKIKSKGSLSAEVLTCGIKLPIKLFIIFVSHVTIADFVVWLCLAYIRNQWLWYKCYGCYSQEIIIVIF
jgi:hypothetical protein